MQTLRDAYYFLQENGYINFGVVKGAYKAVRFFTSCTVPTSRPVQAATSSCSDQRMSGWCVVCARQSALVCCAADHPAPVEEEPAAEDEAPKSPVEDDKAIVFKLYELLRAANMEVRH